MELGTIRHDNYILRIMADDVTGFGSLDYDRIGTLLARKVWRYTLRNGKLDDSFDASEYAIVIPVSYIYHSGVSISASPGSEPNEAGIMGLYVATLDKIRYEYGDTSETSIAKARKVMLGEIEYLDSTMRGEVYGYTLSRIETCEFCGHSDETNEDSRWGFVGRESLEAMAEHWPEDAREALIAKAKGII